MKILDEFHTYITQFLWFSYYLNYSTFLVDWISLEINIRFGHFFCFNVQIRRKEKMKTFILFILTCNIILNSYIKFNLIDFEENIVFRTLDLFWQLLFIFTRRGEDLFFAIFSLFFTEFNFSWCTDSLVSS